MAPSSSTTSGTSLRIVLDTSAYSRFRAAHAGVAEIINAFQCKGWGRFLIWVLLGALYIVAGFVTFENPLFAAAILTLLLGATLVASGIMRIILAFGMKEGMPWMWIVLSGVITFLLGAIILATKGTYWLDSAVALMLLMPVATSGASSRAPKPIEDEAEIAATRLVVGLSG